MKSRLEKLKKTLVLEWGELAAHLGVTRSMLDKVRKGERQPGPHLERRIMEAEVAAGISDSGPTTLQAPPHGQRSVVREESTTFTTRVPTSGKVTLDDLQRLEKIASDLAGELERLKKNLEKRPG